MDVKEVPLPEHALGQNKVLKSYIEGGKNGGKRPKPFVSPIARQYERENGHPAMLPAVKGFEGLKKPARHPHHTLRKSMDAYKSTNHNKILGELYRLRSHLVKQLEARHKLGINVWREGLSV